MDRWKLFDIIWQVAIYVRLSREDDNDKGQSESIENQIKFLKKIVEECKATRIV